MGKGAMRKRISLPELRRNKAAWDDLFLLLAVAQAGSLRKAAELTGQSQPTIGRRLEFLEHCLGVPLVVRGANGVRLTDEGAEAADYALTMSRSMCELEDRFANFDRDVAGEITISCGELLAAPFLAPRLGDLGRPYPNLRIRLITELPTKEPGSGDADVSIVYFEAKNMGSVAHKLGTLHYCLFGTQDYFNVYGAMEDSVEHVLPRHRLLTHTGFRARDPSFSERSEHLFSLANYVVETDSNTCMLEAALSGSVLVGMPSFIALYDPRLQMVNAPPAVQVRFYLVYREAMRESRRLRVVVDWIKSIFERSKNPWFRDEFVHPRDFGEADLPRNAGRYG